MRLGELSDRFLAGINWTREAARARAREGRLWLLKDRDGDAQLVVVDGWEDRDRVKTGFAEFVCVRTSTMDEATIAAVLARRRG